MAPQPARMHVAAPAWPIDMPHPEPAGRGTWLSIALSDREAGRLDAAWRAAGYTGVVAVRSPTSRRIVEYRSYRAGHCAAAYNWPASAAADVAQPGPVSIWAMRLAAALGRASDLLAMAAHRHDSRRMARRIRRLLGT